MDCPECAKPVPEESVFCLHCGTRVGPPERLAPQNGGGQRAEPVTPSAAPAGPGGKRAYAISIRALADERLRYRVARWICEIAPLHALAEVQAGLSAGGFSTFLALTPEEAEETRQRIEALGVHPSLLRLAPASEAELLLPPSPKAAKAKEPSQGNLRQTVLVIGIMVAICVVVGIVWLRLYGR